MADVDYARAQHAGEEITEVARTGATVAAHVCSILDEGLCMEIEVEAPGWTESIAVPSPARPGAVRGAVEKVLGELGLTRV